MMHLTSSDPQTACGSTDTHTCAAVDYTNRIYDSRRRNFWDYTCPWQFATGSATFGGCKLQATPNARTAPQLTYAQPNSFAEYMAGVHDVCEPSKPSSSNALSDNLSSQKPIANVLLQDDPRKPIANVLLQAKPTNAAHSVGPRRSKPYAWQEWRQTGGCVSVGDTRRPGCRQCSIEPSCGGSDNSGSFATSCAPQAPFRRRMRYNGGPVFRPPSSLPALDRYQWSQPESLYWFDSPQEWAEAYDGIYNGNITPRAKFNFQNPAEQTRLWAGVPPPTKAPCASEPGERAAYATCATTNLPYYRNYLESKYACGCNRQRCTQEVATAQNYCTRSTER